MSRPKRKLSLVEEVKSLSEDEKIELINTLKKEKSSRKKYLIGILLIALIFFSYQVYQKIPYWEFLSKCHAPSSVCSCMVGYLDTRLTRDEFALLNDDLDMIYAQKDKLNGFSVLQMVLSNTKGMGTFLSALSICEQK